jgi:hypothetical protein
VGWPPLLPVSVAFLVVSIIFLVVSEDIFEEVSVMVDEEESLLAEEPEPLQLNTDITTTAQRANRSINSRLLFLRGVIKEIFFPI